MSAHPDARRLTPIHVEWAGNIGRITVDGVLWAAVEWSEKPQVWWGEDAEGRCLEHPGSHPRQGAGQERCGRSGTAMIRDGRLPTSEATKQCRKDRLERRRQPPSEQRRRQEREEEARLSPAKWCAERDELTEPPLYELVADAIDLTDPDLWSSNSSNGAPGRPRYERAVNAADTSGVLAGRIDALTLDLLPTGRYDGCEWRVGNVHGDPGLSLVRHLGGSKAGVWSDFATGERGDALDLVKPVLSVDTRKALAWSDHCSAAVAELIRAADLDVLGDIRAP